MKTRINTQIIGLTTVGVLAFSLALTGCGEEEPADEQTKTEKEAAEAVEATKEAAKEIGEATKSAAEDAAKATKEAVNKAAAAIEEKTSEAKESLDESAAEAKEEMKEAAEAVEEKTEEAVEAVEEKTEEAKEVPAETPKDTTTSATAPADYPLTVCVVSGEDLGSMGAPVVLDHNGTTVKFCCDHCVPKFQAEPAKYLTQLTK